MNRAAVGGGDMQPGSLNAPYPTRRDNVIQLAGLHPLSPVTRLHGPEARKHHALIDLRQRLHAAVGSPVAMSRAEEMTSLSLSTCAALKLSQVANAVFDVSVRIIQFLLLASCGIVIIATIAFALLFIE